MTKSHSSANEESAFDVTKIHATLFLIEVVGGIGFVNYFDRINDEEWLIHISRSKYFSRCCVSKHLADHENYPLTRQLESIILEKQPDFFEVSAK